MGVLDFSGKSFSLDASLYDSTVGIFAVSGDMALRLGWGRSPNMVYAIGGFHPRFNPPDNVPDLRRATVAVGNGRNPRISLTGYYAITSNSYQVGAHLDVYAKKGSFSLEGGMGFDALFQFSPFMFIIDIGARVAIKKGRRRLMSLSLKMTLSGPKPWKAKGRVRFKVLFVKVTIRFSVSFGERSERPLPQTQVLPPLLEAIRDLRNWRTALPRERGSRMVTFRELPPAEASALAHPLSRLGFRQTVVPLGMQLERFNGGLPNDAQKVEILRVRVGAEESDFGIQREHFAAGEFLDLTEDEKFSRPAFEALPAGADLSEGGGYKISDSPREVMLQFEQTVIDEASKRPLRLSDVSLPSRLMGAATALNGAQPDRADFYQPVDLGISLAEPAFAVASRHSLQSTDAAHPTGTTYTETHQRMTAQSSRQQRTRQVVQAFEVNA
jgi:hypothetical protein